MKKMNIYNTLIDSKLTVVVRGSNSEEAIRTAQACIEGGIRSLEFTFTNPQAEKAIQHFAAHQDVLVGAGSVLDAETAKFAIQAGAQYVVGPNFNNETAKLCNRYQVPYLPGCMTITEMVQALEAGVSIVKLFPGQEFQPSFIKAVKGPIPHLEVMPTGGVTLDNVKEWFENGAIHVGIGGEITRGAAKGDFHSVTEKAAQFKAALAEVIS